jgi:hypothetical protein
MIFASFHQGKEEKYIALICIQVGQILSSNYLKFTITPQPAAPT